MIQKKLNFDYNSKPKTNHDDKFEEDLKKALEESKKTYENYQTEKIYGNSNMEFEFEEEEIVIEKSKEDIYKEYKKMIYGDEQDIRPSLEENSMFPLRYDDLDPTYLKLEKIAKNYNQF